MIKDLILEFADWNAARLKAKAARTLERSIWWADYAEAMDNGETVEEVQARRRHDEGRDQ